MGWFRFSSSCVLELATWKTCPFHQNFQAYHHKIAHGNIQRSFKYMSHVTTNSCFFPNTSKYHMHLKVIYTHRKRTVVHYKTQVHCHRNMLQPVTHGSNRAGGVCNPAIPSQALLSLETIVNLSKKRETLLISNMLWCPARTQKESNLQAGGDLGHPVLTPRHPRQNSGGQKFIHFFPHTSFMNL
jgi:hypothetical protein